MTQAREPQIHPGGFSNAGCNKTLVLSLMSPIEYHTPPSCLAAMLAIEKACPARAFLIPIFFITASLFVLNIAIYAWDGFARSGEERSLMGGKLHWLL